MFPFTFMTWITKILWILKGRRPCQPLLDDIILVEIISRLPLEDVQRWRLVSKKFKDVTSTPFFAELHTKRTRTCASSAILVRMKEFDTDPMRYFLIGKEYWQGMIPKNISNPETYSNHRLLNTSSMSSDFLLFTYNGLLVLGEALSHPELSFVICNPITKEQVTIHKRNEWLICGLFRHPYTKDYRVLAVSRGSGGFEFYIQCLVPKSPEQNHWRQLIRNFPYRPFNNLCSKPPVVVHDVVHWICDKGTSGKYRVVSHAPCSESILVFDMISENFKTRPHPQLSTCCGPQEDHTHMHLLEMNGELASCILYFNCLPQVKIEIWILEDYANWSWTKKHSSNLYTGAREYMDFVFCKLVPVGVFDGELILHWTRRALFVYNLKRETIRKRKAVFNDGLERGVTMVRYSRTLESLKSFEP